MKVPKAFLIVGVLAVSTLALALVVPQGGLPGLVALQDDVLTAPPEISLRSPADGDGVGARVTLAGEALSSSREILDIEYRVDNGRWQSAPVALRGERVSPFEFPIELPAGDHVLEARAYDGEALSLPARADVRRDAPTVRILEPADGAGIAAGTLRAAGLVRGTAREVMLELAGASRVVPVDPDGLWHADLAAPPGIHTLRAIALGAAPSLPAEARVSAGSPAPPTLTILTPSQNASYGETGDLLCGGACILLTGTAPGAARVIADIDGLPAGAASLTADRLWELRIPMTSIASGTHEARFTPIDDIGQVGASRSARFLARTAVGITIRGADAVEPSGTPLAFSLEGARADNASWSIDGEPAAEGAAVTLVFPTPGDHTLTVQAPGARGRTATASTTIHVLNRLPEIRLLGEPAIVDGKWQFDAKASDADGRIVAIEWDFGDGTTMRTVEPSARHRYLQRGTYAVSATAIDDHGGKAVAGAPIVIANAAPVAAFDWTPAEPTILDVVTLHDKSVDHDGILVERSWTASEENVTSGPNATIRFRTRGPHDVTLRVVDDLGHASILRQTIAVANLPPVAMFRFEPAVALSHQEVVFADGTTDLDGRIASWRWDFGDGTTGNGSQAVHVYRAPGNYTVALHVTDDGGATANTTRTLLVVDSAPEVRTVLLEPPEPMAQEETRLRVVADDRDGSIVAARWSFGDGTTSNETEPLHRFPTSGAYRGEVTVFDEAGLQATFAFHVDVGNAPPIAALVATAPPIAAFPTSLVAEASDPGGRITFYRFDADGDGTSECETTEARCDHVFERPGAYAAHLWVEDDEGAVTEATLLLDVAAPPSDLPPPRVVVEAPSARATLRGDHLFRGEASGTRDVVRVDMQLRTPQWAFSGSREAWRLASGTHEWNVLVDTRAFADGEYDLVVRATDAAGGTGFARIPVTVANGPRPSDVYLRLVDAPRVIDADTGIRGSAFHPEGVTVVRSRIDNGDWRPETESALAFTVEIDRDALKPGEHVLQVEAYHGVGERASAEHVFTVPGTRPALVVDLPPGPEAHALLRAEGRIVGEGRAQWRIDQGLWRDLPPGSEWTLAIDTLDQRTGNHTLHLRAISPDGRLTSDTVSYRVYVINPPFARSIEQEPEPPRVDVPAIPASAIILILVALTLLRRK